MTTEGNGVDLSGAWSALWDALTSTTGSAALFGLLTVLGAAVAVYGAFDWAYWRFIRQGRAQSNGYSQWLIVVGALLATPQAFLPIVLTIVDLVANAVVSASEGII